jgi:general secretion pathway protein K
VLLTVVATLASGMVWQQWRSIEVESAERARTQTAWVLTGALDWARLILREDARKSATQDDLTEPWATPLAEARLSSFLAADRDNNADSDLEAFLGGRIVDAQSRYNLRNLVVDNKLVPAQLAILDRLCTQAGLPSSLAAQLGAQWLSALIGTDASAPLLPQQLADLAWFGLDEATINRLEPLLVLLPRATPVNLNTAPREVLAAVIPAIGLGGADRLVQSRPFDSLAKAAAQLGGNTVLAPADLDVKSSYFEVHGRIRLGERALEEQSLVERRSGQQVVAVQRLRHAALTGAGR